MKRQRLTLHGFTIALSLGALVFVIAIWFQVILYFQPAVRALVNDGQVATERFERFRARATQHELVRTAIEDYVREGLPRIGAADSLRALREQLQDAVVRSPVGAHLMPPPSSAPAFVQGVAQAITLEANLRSAMIGALAALELGDLPAARRAVARAEELERPLTEAVAAATDQALAEVRRRDMRLESLIADESRIVIIWVLVGIILFAAAVESTRRRLRAPLLEIDRGLGRLSVGDLAVRVQGEGDDEIGLIARHLNRAADSLRLRAFGGGGPRRRRRGRRRGHDP